MIQVVYSTQHWIMPRIVIAVLLVLLITIVVSEGTARVKNGGSFFVRPQRFFIENCNHFKLWGTLVLFVAYIFCLDIIGFTVTSIIFVFLFNVLYAGTSRNSIILSVILAVVGSLVISVLFGVIFNITLPSGLCTMTFADLGITLY